MLEISEGGEFIAAQNADPKGTVVSTDPSSFYTYDGHALVAIRAKTSGKITVKALGSGLNSHRITVRVK